MWPTKPPPTYLLIKERNTGPCLQIHSKSYSNLSKFYSVSLNIADFSQNWVTYLPSLKICRHSHAIKSQTCPSASLPLRPYGVVSVSSRHVGFSSKHRRTRSPQFPAPITIEVSVPNIENNTKVSVPNLCSKQRNMESRQVSMNFRKGRPQESKAPSSSDSWWNSETREYCWSPLFSLSSDLNSELN